MAKYGKWIGAGLGLALGGPLGALFGLFIGSMFDNIQTIAIPSDGGPIPPGQTGRGDFTFSLTVLATAVMKADGRIMRSELDYVKTFLIRNFGIEATREAMQMIKELSTRDIPVDDVCQQIRFQMPEALFPVRYCQSRRHRQYGRDRSARKYFQPAGHRSCHFHVRKIHVLR